MVTPLLATKVHIPPLRADFVARGRLLDVLEEGLQRKLTLVSAPAGFGKTTLLSEWHASPREQELALAWVLADEQDNDPVRFWSYVLAAVDGVRAGAADSARILLQALPSPGAARARDRGSALHGVLTALVNDLVRAQADKPAGSALVLVLDDYHTIHARAVHGTDHRIGRRIRQVDAVERPHMPMYVDHRAGIGTPLLPEFPRKLRVCDHIATSSIRRSMFPAAIASLSSNGMSEWATISIPFSAFQPKVFGMTLPLAPPLHRQRITSCGLIISDKQAGPFQLTVESIGAYEDA